MKILLTTLNSKYVHSNLALKYLYCVARRHFSPEDVILQEFTINNPQEYIYGEIVRGNYDLVCFSCYIWNMEKISELGEKLKQACPKMKILCGGPEVSYETEAFMAENPWVDCVIRGEGEDAFHNLCRELAAYGDLPEGIIKGACTGEGEEVFPMENIPFPYDLLPVETDKVIYYETSRGCPYRCANCISSIDKTIRILPMDRVKQELKYFIDKEVKQVKFIDRTFNFDRDRAFEIWDFLIRNDNGKTNFHFEICGELLDNRLLQLLQQARPGLFQMEVGVQSTCADALRAVNRNPKVEGIFENVSKIIGMGNIHMHVDLIAGLPCEDFQTFGKSFNDVYSLGADNLQLGFLKVLKGTEIRKLAEREENLYRYGKKPPYEIISNRWLSSMDIVRLKMIENLLDLYSNKGGFVNSLKTLMNETGAEPFEFYKSLSDFFYEEGYQHRSHKKEDLYRILMKYVVKVSGCDTDKTERLRKVIMKDLEDTMNFDAVKKFYKKGWDI